MKNELKINSLNFDENVKELRFCFEKGNFNKKLFCAILDFLLDAPDSIERFHEFTDLKKSFGFIINTDNNFFQTYFQKFVKTFISLPGFLDTFHLNLLIILTNFYIYNSLRPIPTLDEISVLPMRDIRKNNQLVMKSHAKFNLFLAAAETKLQPPCKGSRLEYPRNVVAFFNDIFLGPVADHDYSSRLFYVTIGLFILLSHFSTYPDMELAFITSCNPTKWEFNFKVRNETVTEKQFIKIIQDSNCNMSLDAFFSLLSVREGNNLQYISYNGEEKSFLFPKQYEPIRFVLQQLIKTHLTKTTLALLKTGVEAVLELPLPPVLTHLISQYLGNNSNKISQWKNLTTLFAQTDNNVSDSQKQTNEKSGSNTLAPS